MVRPGKPLTARFFQPQELLYRKKVRTRANRDRTLRFLKIVIRSLLMVPCFPLNLNHKKRKKETQLLGVQKARVRLQGRRTHIGIATTQQCSSDAPTRLFFFFDPQNHYLSFSFILVSESFLKIDQLKHFLKRILQNKQRHFLELTITCSGKLE